MKNIFLFFLISQVAFSQITVNHKNSSPSNSFEIVSDNQVTTIYYDASDSKLVQKSAHILAQDIHRITGKEVKTTTTLLGLKGNVIIIGSVGQSKIVSDFTPKHKELNEIKGQWERFVIKTITKPFAGVDKALLIAGSDRRGTAFGVFTVSKAIGVSPWYWWADVPIKKNTQLSIKDTTFVSRSPSVKYRGIFLNDEAPALNNWAKETFGGFNHEFYEKVFELILRNKGNYLWPAMWRPSVFSDDDPENLKLADEYGIVISTTHHEPMMRAHEEWSRDNGGAWNYETNKEKLDTFWSGGIERMGNYESVVTLGMRGDGDEAMSEKTAVDLMKNIITEQRKIITNVTKKPIEETPQVWALYKEVQDYYDKGMRVADDITVLFCDDNWGNVRILPKKEDLNHKGGYGMYYHFDFVGGPVSYRWLNVTQIERIWEQMNLSYQWGVKDLWIVNVGDLKPMELPISFFLDYAWDTEAITAENLPDYYENWADQQFGANHAAEIANLLSLSTKYSARRTPEMLKPNTYSFENYREADRIIEEYQILLKKSNAIYKKLPENYKSAFHQLVHYPIEISANLNEMYIAAGRNKLHGNQGRASTNKYADKVKEHFFKDVELTKYYHETMANGKWNHIMSQTHIGYTSWNNPPVNKMPEVSYIQIKPSAELGYVVENGVSSGRRSGGLYSNSFSSFDPINDQYYYLEIFNKGNEKLNYSLETKNEWIQLSSKEGTIEYDEKITVSIDWSKAPKGNETGEILITTSSQKYSVKVPIQNTLAKASGFVENNGVVSIDANHFTKKKDTKEVTWTVIPNMGRTGSAITVAPSNTPRQIPNSKSPHVSYAFTIFNEGDLKIDTYLSPTLNYQKNEGLKYAISIDDEEPQIINIHKGDSIPDWEYPDWWNNSVTDHIRKKQSVHKKITTGEHTLNIWMVDPGVVFQKFVIDIGGLKPSYLGPQESKYIKP